MDAGRRVAVTWAVAGTAGLGVLAGVDAVLRASSGTEPERPTLVQVLPVEDAPLAIPAESGRAYPDETVVEQTFLGESQSGFAYGALSDAGNVCLMVHVNNSGISVQGDCAYEEFIRTGLHADLGFIAVSWFADGTVEWTG